MFTTIGHGARRALHSKLSVAVAAGAVGFGVAGTAAYASIPDGNSVINACVSGTGSLRVIDPASPSRFNKCFSIETPLSWNAKGAPGTPGPAGATGPARPAGPPGSPSSLIFYTKFSNSGTARCDGSDTAVGGGAGKDTSPRRPLVQSAPISDFGKPNGWIAADDNDNGSPVTVICAHQQ